MELFLRNYNNEELSITLFNKMNFQQKNMNLNVIQKNFKKIDFLNYLLMSKKL